MVIGEPWNLMEQCLVWLECWKGERLTLPVLIWVWTVTEWMQLTFSYLLLILSNIHSPLPVSAYHSWLVFLFQCQSVLQICRTKRQLFDIHCTISPSDLGCNILDNASLLDYLRPDWTLLQKRYLYIWHVHDIDHCHSWLVWSGMSHWTSYTK